MKLENTEPYEYKFIFVAYIVILLPTLFMNGYIQVVSECLRCKVHLGEC